MMQPLSELVDHLYNKLRGELRWRELREVLAIHKLPCMKLKETNMVKRWLARHIDDYTHVAVCVPCPPPRAQFVEFVRGILGPLEDTYITPEDAYAILWRRSLKADLLVKDRAGNITLVEIKPTVTYGAAAQLLIYRDRLERFYGIYVHRMIYAYEQDIHRLREDVEDTVLGLTLEQI